MRSSKSFSSRSHTTKYSLRDSVNCPLRENPTRQSFLISKKIPKKAKNSQYSLRQWVEYKQHEHLIDFLILKENQGVISDQAINYIDQGSQDKEIQFIGLMGNEELIAQFMQSVCELSSTEKEEASRQVKQNRQDARISMYMLRIHKQNKTAYFLQPRQSQVNNQNQDKILKTILKLCGNIIIFPSQNPDEDLKHIVHKIDELNSEQKIYKNFNLSPSGCFCIFQKQIICSQSTLQLYQNLFSTITIGSIEQIAPTHQYLNQRIQKNYETVFNIIKQIRQFKLSQEKLHKNAFHVQIIIEYCFQKQNNECIYSSLNSIHPITRNIYNKLLCQAQNSYQQFLNRLNYHCIDKQDQLLDYFYEQEQKTMRKFQSAKCDQLLHEQYLQKLCDYITNFELKMLQNYRCFKVNQSFESAFCDDSIIRSQLNSSQQILKNIDDLNQAIIIEDCNDKYIKQQILILARTASRLHILGYDEKIRIQQIRQEIDYNWSILHQIQLKNQEKLLQPTEQNLSRQKYQNMEQRLIILNDKSIFLQSILANISKQNNEINSFHEIKQNQYKQLQALKRKNQILMDCISSSTDPNAINIQQQILEVKFRSSLVESKKQLIISSIQNINNN